MDEATLQEKLRRIEALHAGATSDGEKEAARRAGERIRERLAEQRSTEPDVEMAYRLPDPWTRGMFVALCRRYGLSPYRRPRQHRTTVQVAAPRTFQETTLWPEFQALSAELQRHLTEITQRVIREVIHDDTSEADELGASPALPE